MIRRKKIPLNCKLHWHLPPVLRMYWCPAVPADPRLPCPPKAGCDVYQIVGNDNLTRIAARFNTTIDYLMAINPTITNRNFIRAGFYMYVPKQK